MKASLKRDCADPTLRPGYWRQEKFTREAFDEEGYYTLGDALKFVDPNDPAKGLLFDCRIAEDFKLSPALGSAWGPCARACLDHFAPYVATSSLPARSRRHRSALIFPTSKPAGSCR
jgi:feruloyl-CoA synthase